jgi:hypothetical protein
VAFDSNGVVANIDALLVGGIGGAGPAYFPVPSTVTSLPAVPSSTTTPGAVPWSSIPVPPNFDPAAPGDALESIPSLDVVEYPETLAPDFIIPPTAQTVTVERGVRIGLQVKRIGYAVVPLEREVAIGVVLGIDVVGLSMLPTGVYVITGQSATLRKTRPIAAETGAFVVTGVAAGLDTNPGLAAETGTFVVVGRDAALSPSAVGMTASTGAFTVTGQAAGFRTNRQATAGTGTVAVTGNSAGLTYSGAASSSRLPLSPIQSLRLSETL